MPKQVFDGKKCTIELDLTNPKDALHEAKKAHKGKDLKTLTQKQKADLFDKYVDAGEIKV